MAFLIGDKFSQGYYLLIEELGLDIFIQLKLTYKACLGVFAVNVITDKQILINRF